MPNAPGWSTTRARAYLHRLPLFTRGIIVAIVAFWVLGLQHVWDVRHWGALVPDKLTFTTLYRINTFPLIHLNVLHALLNVLALTPLLERFEHEHGTLTVVALFLGPLTTIPALLYVIIEKILFRGDSAVMGASIWVFLLLGLEAMKTYKVNPHLVIATHNIPTWTIPLLLAVCISVLVPSTSLLGHLCGLGVGYVCGLGYLKYLAPPEKALRWLETKANLLARVPHYVSVDQTTYGRFGVLPSTAVGPSGQRVPP